MTDRLFGEKGAFNPDIVARIKNPSSCKLYQNRGGTLPRQRPLLDIVELYDIGDVITKNWKVDTIEVSHMQPYLTSLAYRIQCDGKTVVYSGDTGPCGAMEKFAADCDVLIHMCQYISGKEPCREYAVDCTGHMEIAELGRKANARTLVVSHIHEQLDVPGIRERLIMEMGEVYKGNLIWGEDLMDILLSEPDLKQHV